MVTIETAALAAAPAVDDRRPDFGRSRTALPDGVRYCGRRGGTALLARMADTCL